MTATSLSIRGADLSFTLLEEAAGNHTTDNDVAAPVERIIARHGANHVRLRLWVDPVPGWNDLESTLVLARRAHAAGLELLLDLHCSDSWADVRNQNIPAAWRGQPPARLADTLSNYCRDVVQALAEQGTPASMVQVGNEITDGFLWPLGRVHQADGEHWPRLVELLDAGIAGARSGAPPGHDLKVMVHIDRSCDNVGACRFYDRLVDANLLFDVIGLSSSRSGTARWRSCTTT